MERRGDNRKGADRRGEKRRREGGKLSAVTRLYKRMALQLRGSPYAAPSQGLFPAGSMIRHGALLNKVCFWDR